MDAKKTEDTEKRKHAKDFGGLVRALRREHIDEEDKIWTRAKLSQESNLSVGVIEDIELGERLHLDPDDLKDLARALNLTSRERREFFFIASGIAGEDAARRKEDAAAVLENQLQIISKIRLPCFLIDVFSNVVAVNGAIATLFGIGQKTLASARERQVSKAQGQRDASEQASEVNLLRVIFEEEQLGFRTAVGRDWERYAKHNIQYSRVLSLRYRNTEEFKRIYRELLKLRRFKELWSDAWRYEEDHYSTSLHYEYDHPQFRHLSYFTASSITITGYGELSLIVYLPATVETAEVFTRLVHDRDVVWRLAAWPEYLQQRGSVKT